MTLIQSTFNAGQLWIRTMSKCRDAEPSSVSVVDDQGSGDAGAIRLISSSRAWPLIGSVVIAGAFIQPALGQVRESACQGAKVAFPQAVKEVQERLQRYAECIDKSNGSENCSSEFLRLRTAQSSLETITTQHRTFCRD